MKLICIAHKNKVNYMDCALRSLKNKNVIRCCLNVSNFSSARRSPGGRVFHTRGPAAVKLLSPKLLWVLGTSSVLLSLGLTGVSDGQRPTGGDNHRRGTRALLQQGTGAPASQSWKRLADELAASAAAVALVWCGPDDGHWLQAAK